MPNGLLLMLLLGCLQGIPVLADQPTQFWPELGAFVTLSPRMRLFFDLPYTKDLVVADRSLETAVYLDVSLVPVRKHLRSKDWARNKYLWFRIGYDHILNASGRTRTPAEDRLILELRARAGILPAQWVLEGRVRTDLRWIEGRYSTRYRMRLEVTREYSVHGHAVTPYFNYEWYYDPKLCAWTRTLAQAGAEITCTDHFRFEVYLARQVDGIRSTSTTNALGLFLKWYF